MFHIGSSHTTLRARTTVYCNDSISNQNKHGPITDVNAALNDIDCDYNLASYNCLFVLVLVVHVSFVDYASCDRLSSCFLQSFQRPPFELNKYAKHIS